MGDVQAVIEVCLSGTEEPLETLRPGEITMLQGRHLVAAREVLAVGGPRVYVAIHSAMKNVFSHSEVPEP